MITKKLRCTAFLLIALTAANAQSPTRKESAMSHHATGTFEVKAATLEPYNKGDKLLGRNVVDKRFQGDLEATSIVEMLSAGTEVKGSGGYVAIEKVTGTLGGRKGTFVLQHSGTMNRGALQLSVTVVPDSATGDLAGLSGKMNIIIENGNHRYDFEYQLPQ